MTATVTRNTVEKARKLVAERRMHPISVQPGLSWLGVADGDTGRYLVALVAGEAMPDLDGERLPARAFCECPRFTHGELCSHLAAARILIGASS